MSAIFDPDLGERISHFVQQDDGRLITGMVVVMDYIDEDGVQCTSVAVAPDQKATTSAGLIALGQAMSNYELKSWISENNEGGTA